MRSIRTIREADTRRACFAAALGIRQSDWRYLHDQAVADADVRGTRITPHGACCTTLLCSSTV
jgi:hypothetical protein